MATKNAIIEQRKSERRSIMDGIIDILKRLWDMLIAFINEQIDKIPQ